MASLRIDDQDAALDPVGQVAAILQVTQAFLRRLDEHAVACPGRSAGGQRRYSRRQTATAARARDLAGERSALTVVRRVLALEDRISQLEADLDAARAESASRRTELAAAKASAADARPVGRAGGAWSSPRRKEKPRWQRHRPNQIPARAPAAGDTSAG